MAESESPEELLPAELHKQVEVFSLIFERFGYPRMAGRIFALMLLRDEPLITQAELAQVLQASTGSISTMIRLLEQLGFVERVSLPGDRRDRFRLREDPFVEMSLRRIEGARQMTDLIQSARASDAIGPRADARLEQAQAFYEYFTDEMDRALHSWREEEPDPETDSPPNTKKGRNQEKTFN